MGSELRGQIINGHEFKVRSETMVMDSKWQIRNIKEIRKKSGGFKRYKTMGGLKFGLSPMSRNSWGQIRNYGWIQDFKLETS